MTDNPRRALFVVSVSPELADRVSAGDIARALAAAGNGGGGGRQDFAQGGFDAGRLADVEAAFWALLTEAERGD